MMHRIIWLFLVFLAILSFSPKVFSEVEEGPCRRDPFLVRCLPPGCQELNKAPHIYEQECITADQALVLERLGLLTSDKEGYDMTVDLSRQECKRLGGEPKTENPFQQGPSERQQSQFFRQTEQGRQAQQTRQAEQTQQKQPSPEDTVPCTLRMSECRCEEERQETPEQREKPKQERPEEKPGDKPKDPPDEPPVEIRQPPVPVPIDKPIDAPESKEGSGEVVRVDGRSPSSPEAVPIFFCVADSPEMYETSTGRAWPMAEPCPRLPRERLVSPEQFAFSDNVRQFIRDQRQEDLETVQQNTVHILDQVLEGKTNHPIVAVTLNQADEQDEGPLVTLTPLQDRPEKFRKFREHFEENFQIDNHGGQIVAKQGPSEEEGTYIPLIPEDLDSPEGEDEEEESGEDGEGEGKGKKPKKKPGEDHDNGPQAPDVPTPELPAQVKPTQTVFPDALPRQSVLIMADQAEALGGGCSLLP